MKITNFTKLSNTKKIKFAKMYYQYVCDCLTEDKLWEELALFKLGADVYVRQNELLSITYSQIDFPMVRKVPILKIYKGQKRQYYYNDIRISEDTYRSIIDIWYQDSSEDDRIFKRPMEYYIKRIQSSTGDNQFSHHMMRHIGAMLFRNEFLSKVKE